MNTSSTWSTIYVLHVFSGALECYLSSICDHALVPPCRHPWLFLPSSLLPSFPEHNLTLFNLSLSIATAMHQNAQQFVCTDCDRQFGRIQELRRHLRERHEPPRRCPFCEFTWTRPDKIKDHITRFHPDNFTVEVMAVFRALHGKNLVAFLDDFEHGPGVEPALHSSHPLDSSPS